MTALALRTAQPSRVDHMALVEMDLRPLLSAVELWFQVVAAELFAAAHPVERQI